MGFLNRMALCDLPGFLISLLFSITFFFEAHANALKPEVVDLEKVRGHALSALNKEFCSHILTEQGVWFWENGDRNDAAKQLVDYSHLLFLVSTQGQLLNTHHNLLLGYRYKFDGTSEAVVVEPMTLRNGYTRFYYININQGSAFLNSSNQTSYDARRVKKILEKKFPQAKFGISPLSRVITYQAPDLNTGILIYRYMNRSVEFSAVYFVHEPWSTNVGYREIPVSLGDGLHSQKVDINALRTTSKNLIGTGYVFQSELRLPPVLTITRKGKSKY
jgi:hypothetical protein